MTSLLRLYARLTRRVLLVCPTCRKTKLVKPDAVLDPDGTAQINLDCPEHDGDYERMEHLDWLGRRLFHEKPVDRKT